MDWASTGLPESSASLWSFIRIQEIDLDLRRKYSNHEMILHTFSATSTIFIVVYYGYSQCSEYRSSTLYVVSLVDFIAR